MQRSPDGAGRGGVRDGEWERKVRSQVRETEASLRNGRAKPGRLEPGGQERGRKEGRERGLRPDEELGACSRDQCYALW